MQRRTAHHRAQHDVPRSSSFPLERASQHVCGTELYPTSLSSRCSLRLCFQTTHTPLGSRSTLPSLYFSRYDMHNRLDRHPCEEGARAGAARWGRAALARLPREPARREWGGRACPVAARAHAPSYHRRVVPPPRRLPPPDPCRPFFAHHPICPLVQPPRLSTCPVARARPAATLTLAVRRLAKHDQISAATRRRRDSAPVEKRSASHSRRQPCARHQQRTRPRWGGRLKRRPPLFVSPLPPPPRSSPIVSICRPSSSSRRPPSACAPTGTLGRP